MARYGNDEGNAVVGAALAMFQSLPLAYVVEARVGKVLVLHGGLPRDPETTLADMNRLDRFR